MRVAGEVRTSERKICSYVRTSLKGGVKHRSSFSFLFLRGEGPSTARSRAT